MSRNPKAFNLSPDLHQYLIEHGSPPDEIAQRLIERTRALGGIARMQIAPEQGAFMELLVRISGARRIIELGTFTGYSALCLARGLPQDGQLICCDLSEEWTSIGRPYWEEAGVANRIDLRIGPALGSLKSLAPDQPFDLAFIDADKTNYIAYGQELLRLVRPGGLLLADNVLWGGNIIDATDDREATLALRAFNDWAVRESRLQVVMLPVSDGLSIMRVR